MQTKKKNLSYVAAMPTGNTCWPFDWPTVVQPSLRQVDQYCSLSTQEAFFVIDFSKGT